MCAFKVGVLTETGSIIRVSTVCTCVDNVYVLIMSIMLLDRSASTVDFEPMTSGLKLCLLYYFTFSLHK